MVALVTGLLPVDLSSSSGLLCCSCGFLLIRPKQTVCGHRYCESCAASLFLESETGKCRVCQEKILKSQVFFDKAAENDISKTDIMCPNSSHGCSWKGKLKAYLTSHEKECKYGLEPCSNANFGCEFTGTQKELVQHESQHCAWRMVYCHLCSTLVAYSLLQEHILNCPQNKALFVEMLKPRSTASEVNPKSEICDKDKGCCPFEKVGCSEKPKSMVDHLLTSYPDHLLQVLSAISNLECRLNRGEEINTGFKKLVMGKLVSVNSLITSHKELDGEENIPKYTDQHHEENQTLKKLISVLSEDLSTCSRAVEELQKRCLAYEKTIIELQSRTQHSSSHLASDNGILIWKIEGFSACVKTSLSQSRSTPYSLYSPAFLSHSFGYKLCCRLYPGGDGMGKGTHVSLFLSVMKGEFDDILPWPFKQKVTFILLDQSGAGQHVKETFIPDPLSGSFQKPKTSINVASGCPQFIKHSVLFNPQSQYLKNDVLYLKAIIDKSGIML
ncbi:TNF receptor-associated factor 3-like [Polypterus senegalus]|uniref:TNF receptor-associated factor 3-like n=1 Tax=Polypterus senegalus TaxID=55291 RepID=UPI001966B544|nr:TNF receptor-associated factor 3-like [Polypterus senegalus]